MYKSICNTYQETNYKTYRNSNVKRKRIVIGYVRKRMMEMMEPGRRKRGGPRRRWMDLAREDMERVGANEGDQVDLEKWKILLRCGDPE